MYMVFWKVWMHEWYMGQQIISRAIYRTSDCEIRWVIRLDETGLPLAETGIYVRLGSLINHKNSSFLQKKYQNCLACQSAHISRWGFSPYIPQPWGNGVSRKLNQTKHWKLRQTRKQTKSGLQAPWCPALVWAWARHSVTQPWIIHNWGTRDRHSEVAGTVKGKVWQELKSLKLPCPTPPTWWDSCLPAAAGQGWAHTTQTRTSP